MKVKGSDRDGSQSRPRHQRHALSRNTFEPRGPHSNQGPEGQLPGTGERREIRTRGVAQINDGKTIEAARDQQRSIISLMRPYSCFNLAMTKNRGRIDQVHLFLDRQRPKVL